jgi:ribosome-binding ATPase YchF (GTP1/OBG family)
MKLGLVGYQGSGKSTVFELLTGNAPDVSKGHTGQIGSAFIPDDRFDKLVRMFQPKKVTPARIELFDTPGLSRDDRDNNAQRLGIIREATALLQMIGVFNAADTAAEMTKFAEDLVLADLQVVSNRLDRVRKDATKPRPDRADLEAEIEALEPIEAKLEAGETTADMEFTKLQDQVTRSFSLLTHKPRLVVFNTADSAFDESTIASLEAEGHKVVAAPFGLELEVGQLPESERGEFAAEMGLGEPSRERLLQAIFEITDQITFYTCDEKEVHAWLLPRGANVLEAAHSIHTDLARGFIRAEVMSTTDLLRLGSEREVKAAGLHHVEGKEYIVQDGDEIVIRFNV